jgi:molecular chaperone IbpA
MSRDQLTLRSLDIPTIHKFGIGFDTIVEELLRLSVQQQQNNANYPPYNVIKIGEESILIELAIAGFTEGEIEISVCDNILSITGRKVRVEGAEWEYHHRGISMRDFSREFTLADYVEVEAATVKNGILSVYLERKLPESKKSKQIVINYNK